MEYLGTVAPFYVSRYRVKVLDSLASGSKYDIKGSVAIPGVGEIQFARNSSDTNIARMLERVLTWLARQHSIGNAWDRDCDYAWINIQATVSRVADAEKTVDHIIFADVASLVPQGWSCVLIGARANLTALNEVDLPQLGSSPLAVQWVLQHFQQQGSNASIPRRSTHSGETCLNLLAAAQAATQATDGFRWRIQGVVEVLERCAEHSLLVGAPLFLSYDGGTASH